ncbi:hypothetical protein BDA96_03G347700 [Sorghum bicolor]|uniref:40S ribosomal protein S25 n=1 Tax=Sorghum bicolor TaxID=4558 RepID=A0A921UPG5_SORBI|nr:hypothetical protein BDA96_03G347700 [Sorghum bicolor]
MCYLPRQTPECELSLSTFSPAWEVAVGAAEAVDAGAGGRDAVAAVPFGLVVGLLLSGGSDGRTEDPIVVAAQRLVNTSFRRGWGRRGLHKQVYMHPRKCSSSPPIGSDGGEHASPAQNPTAKIYLLLALTRIAYSPPPRPPLRRSPHASAMAPKKEKAPPPSSKPAKSGGGKQKKKKWSKGKQKEKVNNSVLFDQATYDKLVSEVPKYKQITPSVLSERLRINGSLARRAIKDLMARGLIRMVSVHSSQQIYTRATNT